MKQVTLGILLFLSVHFISCGNDTNASTQQKPGVGAAEKTTPPAMATSPSQNSVADGPSIAVLETNDFILKIHRAIPFQLKPKSYEPFKVDPSTKLVVLDISVRNKLSTPIDFSRILGMTVLKGKGDKNLMAPWVVAAYEVDYPEPNHQKEYDALWSSNFQPNGFHRAVLIGLNPPKEQDDFKLIVPEKPDFNNPSKRELNFKIE